MADRLTLCQLTPPSGEALGMVSCDACGRTWTTTGADTDELLADLFAHLATHQRPETGSGPSSAAPNISTR